ncbi:MAG TPA: GyrI-like domain-containing protein, partial [Pirellulaceae bacterium]
MDTFEITAETRMEQPSAVRTATLSVADLQTWMGPTYDTVARFLTAHHSDPAGPPFARFHQVDQERFRVDAGFPVPTPIEGDGDVQAMMLPGGRVATTLHVGPYDAMEPAYRAVAEWITAHHATADGDAWEIYFSDPG